MGFPQNYLPIWVAIWQDEIDVESDSTEEEINRSWSRQHSIYTNNLTPDSSQPTLPNTKSAHFIQMEHIGA